MTAVVEAQTAISSSIGNGTGNAAAAIAGANGATGSKLHGYAFYESIGRPKFVIAPMVDQSELVSLISLSGCAFYSNRRGRGGGGDGIRLFAVRLSFTKADLLALFFSLFLLFLLGSSTLLSTPGFN